MAIVAALIPAPVLAKDSLGVFDDWATFRDPAPSRCYAIARSKSDASLGKFKPFASIGNWPGRNVRGQVHFRLSREIDSARPISLIIGEKTFVMTGGGANVWGRDKKMDAAIVAAMRSASRMNVRATDSNGRRFANAFSLKGAATAIDAASVGCARIRR
ncbi:invasion associated locus B family protein [Altererythrobacter aquiaggeris]|uniref:invasion associated locus B family protein n=1 Tax=Aestuarierythrobacter aquiaggeris TaxID=1898396 RepID=UPI00301A62F8